MHFFFTVDLDEDEDFNVSQTLPNGHVGKSNTFTEYDGPKGKDIGELWDYLGMCNLTNLTICC